MDVLTFPAEGCQSTTFQKLGTMYLPGTWQSSACKGTMCCLQPSAELHFGGDSSTHAPLLTKSFLSLSSWESQI